MKSPFPGMDPYIEECGLFEDLQQALIDEMARALAKSVPSRYIVRRGERPYVALSEAKGVRPRGVHPDVSVVAPSDSPAARLQERAGSTSSPSTP